jgi:putative sugar O-methyltransferase
VNIVLVEDDWELLSTMMSDRRNQAITLGPIWTPVSERIFDGLKAHGMKRFRRHPEIVKGFAEVIPTDPLSLIASSSAYRQRLEQARQAMDPNLLEEYNRHIDRYARRVWSYKERLLQTTMSPVVSEYVDRYGPIETRLGAPVNVVPFPSGHVSEYYVRAISWTMSLHDNLDLANVRTIVEIGGGFGAMCHTLLHSAKTVRQYVYVDIPPALYIGTQYLRAIYGSNVLTYLDVEAEPQLLASPRSGAPQPAIYCITPWQFDQLSIAYDLAWNSCSFQEMDPRSLGNYITKLSTSGRPESALAVMVYDHQKPPAMDTVETIKRAGAWTGDPLDVDRPSALPNSRLYLFRTRSEPTTEQPLQ